ncbi:P-loop containing nucleoside triphosphate hydrolase protein [Sparassis latifolia]|uniref:G domain-containing protein n=1 Tax=Sparassis crispa TaxID=139825 RepID=A0A401GQM6_9APHY|nr:hypothetical protein SCP_0605300 [Sparassis crispa]GBE84551.1 hypothetical protein SCP_0605300 [Sparassis crispa]
MGIKNFLGKLFARRVELDEIKQDDIIILVVGPTGSGKSSFINTAAKKHLVSVGHGLASRTSTVKTVKCLIPNDGDGRSVIFVDTPAFNNSEKTIAEVENVLERWLKQNKVQNNTIAGILYLHPISQPRMTERPAAHLARLMRLAGDDPKRILLVTTMWPSGDRTTAERREGEILEKYWNGTGRDDAIHYEEQTPEAAWIVVERLLEGSDH